MSRTTILVAGLVASLGFSIAVMAQSAPASADAQATGNQASQRPAKAAPIIKPGDRNCLRQTGSLIPPK